MAVDFGFDEESGVELSYIGWSYDKRIKLIEPPHDDPVESQSGLQLHDSKEINLNQRLADDHVTYRSGLQLNDSNDTSVYTTNEIKIRSAGDAEESQTMCYMQKSRSNRQNGYMLINSIETEDKIHMGYRLRFKRDIYDQPLVNNHVHKTCYVKITRKLPSIKRIKQQLLKSVPVSQNVMNDTSLNESLQDIVSKVLDIDEEVSRHTDSYVSINISDEESSAYGISQLYQSSYQSLSSMNAYDDNVGLRHIGFNYSKNYSQNNNDNNSSDVQEKNRHRSAHQCWKSTVQIFTRPQKINSLNITTASYFNIVSSSTSFSQPVTSTPQKIISTQVKRRRTMAQENHGENIIERQRANQFVYQSDIEQLNFRNVLDADAKKQENVIERPCAYVTDSEEQNVHHILEVEVKKQVTIEFQSYVTVKQVLSL
ncbi:unnamed protein product [Rotaria magnacalcarata]|uniref:Uncharacterized protein n=1 Tax=Rotaria magnacalcarata TaxID=392030 RepID=A0A816P4E3_9BILA|nr:unnamed protein product [Rotaria magnacalcarata]